jgi:hypothetical protein
VSFVEAIRESPDYDHAGVLPRCVKLVRVEPSLLNLPVVEPQDDQDKIILDYEGYIS